MIQNYRKKPVVIQACKITEKTEDEIKRWSNNAVFASPVLEPTEHRQPFPSFDMFPPVEQKLLKSDLPERHSNTSLIGAMRGFYPCTYVNLF